MSLSAGKIWIVGAGTGPLDLLTVRALRAIQSADLILFDRLVSAEILAAAKPNAESVDVGKRDGHHHTSQDQIHRIFLANRHRQVVRLKAGDPFVFGRGGEEVLFCRQHGIDVEWIPGITSALGVPSLAGIPVVHRGVARSFTVVTGCGAGLDLIDWPRYAGADTLIVLMGVHRRAEIAAGLIGAGRHPLEPVAFIERSGSVVEGVLSAALSLPVKSPAVMVVGEVVRLRAAMLDLVAEASWPLS